MKKISLDNKFTSVLHNELYTVSTESYCGYTVQVKHCEDILS